jgi:hypothetical protein
MQQPLVSFYFVKKSCHQISPSSHLVQELVVQQLLMEKSLKVQMETVLNLGTSEVGTIAIWKPILENRA